MAAAAAYPPVGPVTFAALCTVFADVARDAMQSGRPPRPGENPYPAAAAARGIDPAWWSRAQLVWGCRAMLDPELGLEQGREIGRLIMPNMPDTSAMMGAVAVPPPPTVDPHDPGLAPIDGVSIDAYVRLIAAQIASPGATADQARDWAVQLGFPADRWYQVSLEWGNRVTAGPPASVRYAQLVCELLG